MKRVQTSLFFVVVMVVLALCGSVWGVESSESIQGIISHWKFDEGSGTTAYDSASDNHGTIYGAQWTTGQIDGALGFDGDDYVSVPDSASLDITGDEITVVAWFKPGATGNNNRPIVSKWLGSNSAYVLRYKTGSVDLIDLLVNTGGTIVGAFNPTPVNDINKWYHLAGVYDGSHITVYIDGVAGAPVANTGNINNSSKSLRISGYGEGAVNPHHIIGLVDDVQLYDRALSAEEVQQLYQDGSAEAEVIELEIMGLDEVAENFSASYKAIAHYDDDSTRDVTSATLWAVEPNTAANIDENGVLRTKDIVKDRSATILASYTEGDVTVEAEKAIDILAICPTGTALQFDGVDDYVDCGGHSSLDVTELTWALWIKRAETTYTDERALISNEGGGNNTIGTYALQIDVGGSKQNRIQFVRHGSGYVLSNTAIQDTYWHHIAVTRDSSNNVFIYIDGQEDGNGTVRERTAFTKTVIGSGYTHYSDFYGIIDDVRIYNRALSAEEIWANMHRRLAGDEPGLVGYWDFDEGEGQIVYDLSDNGNSGTLGSTPNPDVSDPAWVESDAPVGICSLYQIATMAAERALWRKLALLEELLAGLADEWTAYEALEEWLESGDYGDLNKGDIVKAKQKIHSATQHEEQSIDALEKSIEKLEDALRALGYEPEPPPPPPGQASNPNPANEARWVGINADLSWTAGSDAASHDVYFGTTSPGTFRGNQTATTFDPGTMAYGATYYWRIDEVNAGGTTTGTVWSFTTGGGPGPR